MMGAGQIVVAHRPESRASGAGAGLHLSAYFMEEPPKCLEKTGHELDLKTHIEN